MLSARLETSVSKSLSLAARLETSTSNTPSLAARLETSVSKLVSLTARLEISTSTLLSLATKLEMSVSRLLSFTARLEISISRLLSLAVKLETAVSILVLLNTSVPSLFLNANVSALSEDKRILSPLIDSNSALNFLLILIYTIKIPLWEHVILAETRIYTGIPVYYFFYVFLFFY